MDNNRRLQRRHSQSKYSNMSLTYFAKIKLPLEKDNTFEGFTKALRSFAMGVPMQITFQRDNLPIIRCIYHCPRCFVHWIKNWKVKYSCTRSGNLTPGPEYTISLQDLQRLLLCNDRGYFCRITNAEKMIRCIQRICAGNFKKSKRFDKKDQNFWKIFPLPTKSGIVGLRKTSGEFYPGYFKFDNQEENVDYESVKFVALSVIDDDGCHHTISDGADYQFPTLADLINKTQSMRYSFSMQDGSEINPQFLTQGLVFNKNQNQYFFTQTYDSLNNAMKIICVFTSSGMMYSAKRSDDSGDLSFDLTHLDLPFKISKLTSLYGNCSTETSPLSQIENGSLFIGGSLGPDEKFYPYGSYSAESDFKQRASSISSSPFQEIFVKNNEPIPHTSNPANYAMNPSCGPPLDVQTSIRSLNRRGSNDGSLEGLVRRPSIIFVKEVDVSDEKLPKPPTKKTSELNPAVRNRTGKPATKAGSLSDGTAKVPQDDPQQIDYGRRPSTRASMQSNMISTPQMRRPSTNMLGQRKSSVIDTNSRRPTLETRRSEMERAGGTPATFARQREIEKKMRKEKDEVKAKYQNAAHHSMLNSDTAGTLALGGTKTSTSVLKGEVSISQDVGQSSRVPVLRQTTAERSKVRKRRSVATRQSQLGSKENMLNEMLSNQVNDLPEKNSDDGLLTQEALGAMFLSDEEEDEKYNWSDFSDFSSDEEGREKRTSNKSAFFPFLDGLSNLSFTKNFNFSYFLAPPEHVKEQNSKLKKGVLKLPVLYREKEKPPPREKRVRNKKTQLMRRIEKLNEKPVV